MEVAAEPGHPLVLQWLENQDFKLRTPSVVYICAVSNENMKALEWLYTSGYRCSGTTICDIAALSGNLPMIQWLREHGFSWSSTACSKAASKGHLELLKWMHECPWNEDSVISAARYGYLETLKWLINNGCPWSIDNLLLNAVRGGSVEVLEYSNTFPHVEWRKVHCQEAVFTENFEALKWLIDKKCPWKADIFLSIVHRYAAKTSGKVLRWIKKQCILLA